MPNEPMSVKVVLAPGLDELIRELGAQMFGADARREDLGQLTSQLLPLLVSNALAGDLPPPPDPDEEAGEGVAATQEDKEAIATAIAEATQHVESLDPRQPTLEINEQEQPPIKIVEEPLLTMEEMEKAGVNSKALAWARGNPLKERALQDTVRALNHDLWSWDRVLLLSERVFNMNQEDDDARK